MRKGIVALGAVAFLAANVSWAAQKPVTVKTPNGRTFKATIDESRIVEVKASKLKLVAHWTPEELKAKKNLKLKPMVVSPTAQYWNVETSLGTQVLMGGATAYAGTCGGVPGTNTRTLLIADDTTFFDFAGSGSQAINDQWFTTYNGNAGPTQAGVLVLWSDDAGGVPGGFGGIVWTFDSTFPVPTGLSLWNGGDLSSFAITMASTAIWTGTGYDDRCAGMAVTAAELNNLGAGLFGPVDVGSSTDNLFYGNAVPYGNPATGTVSLGPGGSIGFGTEFVPTPVMLQKFKAE